MKILIKTTNIELNDALEEYVNTKVGSLRKYFKKSAPDLIVARVEIGKPSKHHRRGMVYYAEINLDVPGKLLRAESKHIDLRYAINKTKGELERQIKKYKDRK